MPSKLVFVDDRQPGLTRRALRHGWAYYDSAGNRITDRDEIDRLNAIALPPAYRDAWFCPHPHGHLLATGIDARGRKQYRYHPEFRTSRECVKYDSLIRFGQALPTIRKQVAGQLAGRRLSRERAIASVVRLLDTGAIRIGNEAYARENKSFGATTLRKRHARLSTKVLRLRFRAKSGKLRELDVDDRDLIRFVKAIQDLPGQHLFHVQVQLAAVAVSAWAALGVLARKPCWRGRRFASVPATQLRTTHGLRMPWATLLPRLSVRLLWQLATKKRSTLSTSGLKLPTPMAEPTSGDCRLRLRAGW